ncbi:alanine racemase [Vibrio sp. Of7-15]|uniref:alanine racemase n=1 Tax=Vibrio sp. Of7-15 TaxID=2724879 RepID=UPI001EF19080|nr:alanine racemase [Vibrio sp. Of7-15]MCG7496026.1 alanine racemase [Vibrio sp. Of7-15]
MKLKKSLIALSISLLSANAAAAPLLVTYDDMPYEYMTMQPNAWLDIDTTIFENNIRHAQNAVSENTKICAIMKADAYGNGIENLIGSVIASGIPCVGITSNEEARVVREKGFDGQLMRVRAAAPHEIEAALQYDIEELVGTVKQAKIISRIAKRNHQRVSVHLALDSAGMGRNGLDMSTRQGKRDALKIADTKRLNIVGMMTHFPTEDLDKTRAGLEQFKSETSWLIRNSDLNREDVTLHAANSYTTLMLPEAHLDMVRPGGLLYGDTTPLFPEYKRIFSFKTQVASVHKFKANTTVGYGNTAVLERDSLLANLPMGYSDGYPRSLSNNGYVLINGQRAKIVGKISMNTMMVDVTDIKGVRPGSEVTLFGKQGGDEITITEMEDNSGRILPDLYTIWGVSNPKYIK